MYRYLVIIETKTRDEKIRYRVISRHLRPQDARRAARLAKEPGAPYPKGKLIMPVEIDAGVKTPQKRELLSAVWLSQNARYCP